MEAILSIADKHNLFVIEDTAQAIGDEYRFSNREEKKAGCMGYVGCTSLFHQRILNVMVMEKLCTPMIIKLLKS
jgi:dTDP-4-amino-4,6-dideoxygalactose transaminase